MGHTFAIIPKESLGEKMQKRNPIEKMITGTSVSLINKDHKLQLSDRMPNKQLAFWNTFCDKSNMSLQSIFKCNEVNKSHFGDGKPTNGDRAKFTKFIRTGKSALSSRLKLWIVTTVRSWVINCKTIIDMINKSTFQQRLLIPQDQTFRNLRNISSNIAISRQVQLQQLTEFCSVHLNRLDEYKEDNKNTGNCKQFRKSRIT